jgi:hypothetical protein
MRLVVAEPTPKYAPLADASGTSPAAVAEPPNEEDAVAETASNALVPLAVVPSPTKTVEMLQAAAAAAALTVTATMTMAGTLVGPSAPAADVPARPPTHPVARGFAPGATFLIRRSSSIDGSTPPAPATATEPAPR